MRIAIALLTLVFAPAVVRAADADLDRTFGTFGVAEVDPSAARDGGTKVALQPDGKIVLAGWANAAGGGQWRVARFNPDGTLDPSFSGDGIAAESTTGYAEAVAVQPDGKILVAGIGYGPSDLVTSVMRLESDGDIDPTFGVGGITTVDVVPASNDDEWPRAMIVQSDGSIVVVGYSIDFSTMPPSTTLFVYRLLPDGTPDTSFGPGGINPVTFAESSWGFDVAQQPDGKIVVAGFTGDGAPGRLVFRLDDDGTLDASFGAGGVVIDGPGPTNRLGTGVALLPDGKILVGGTSGVVAEVARYLPSGSADGSFGVAGLADAADPGGQYLFILDMAVQSDGKIVLAGSLGRPLGDFDVALVRFDADGAPDTGFAPGGVARVLIGSDTSIAYGVLAQPNDKIVVTGIGGEIDFPDPTTDTRIFVARVGNTCGDGTVDPDEQCDDGNAVNGDCCSVACRVEPSGQECGTPDANDCTFNACDGAGTCVVNQPVPAGTECGELDADPCTFQACDGAGTCATQPSLAGTPCGDSDASPCTVDACDGTGVCITGQPLPASACLAPTLPLRASLRLADQSDDTRDRLTWKWTRGPEVTDFGQPNTSTGYTLCLFAGSSLIGENPIPAGSGWSSSSKGWKLTRTQPVPGGGITKAKLVFGGFGRSRITIQGRGPLLGLPSLPLATPVTVQLVSTTGACFRASYTSPSINTAAKFRAKGS